MKEVSSREYLSYINDPRNHPAMAIFAMKQRIGVWDFRKILIEANLGLYDITEEEKLRKRGIIFLIHKSIEREEAFKCR